MWLGHRAKCRQLLEKKRMAGIAVPVRPGSGSHLATDGNSAAASDCKAGKARLFSRLPEPDPIGLDLGRKGPDPIGPKRIGWGAGL